MVRRAGSADLPLHGGHVPAWLGQRMARLGAVIVEAIGIVVLAITTAVVVRRPRTA